MPLNGFTSIRKFNKKNVKTNSIKVKMKIIILIEKANADYLNLDICYQNHDGS